tara:strand:- start:35 stop:268 length:234 start_codon:yes stop_codon:yes gene_type:complete
MLQTTIKKVKAYRKERNGGGANFFGSFAAPNGHVMECVAIGNGCFGAFGSDGAVPSDVSAACGATGIRLYILYGISR